MFCFNIQGEPQSEARPRARRIGKGVSIYSPKSKERKAVRKEMAFYAPPEPSEGIFTLHIVAFFSRPNSHYGRKNGQPYLKNIEYFKETKPDIDNIAKFYMDAMNGIFYADDKQVVRVTAIKRYVRDEESPHVEITLREVGEM